MQQLARYLVAFALALTGLAHAAVVGRIEAEGGQVERWGPDGQPRTAHVLAHLEQGDVIATGQDGWVVLSMVDSASLTLKPNSRLRVGDYTFKPAAPKQSNIFLELLTGSLRSITGLIGHANPEAYLVKTPTATMGIRGTDHEILVVTEHDESQTPPGTYDHVYDGRTVMHTATGTINLAAGETAVAHAGGGAPEHLEKQPAAYDKLQKFSKEKGIDTVLEHLHRHSGQGFGLPAALAPATETKTAEKTGTDSAADKKADAASTTAEASKTADKDASDKASASDASKTTGKEAAEKPATEAKPATGTDSKAGSTEKKPTTPPPPPKHK